jgi:hypothetical protein
LFQLSERLAAGEFEPFVLGLAHRHARELAHGGPADLAARERALELRQPFERLGHAQLFLKRARLVAKHAFDVFVEAAEPQVHVHGRTLCGQQPAPFFGIRGRSFSGEPGQCFMSDLPGNRLALQRSHVECCHAFRHNTLIFVSLSGTE